MSGSNEPHHPQVADLDAIDDLDGTSINGWMNALAASPAPPPKLLSTAIVLRRARLEARLASQRAQTRRALRPAYIAEAVGVLSTAVVSVCLVAPPGGQGLFGDTGDIAIFAGLSSSAAVVAILVTLLLLLWFAGDEPSLAG